ncbi:UNVERIFIED_CONTAM: hypothetical protein FKN15_071107 [Acipenser sinensis]
MSPNEVYSWKRTSPLAGSSSAKTIFTEDRQSGAVKQTNCVSLLGANQLIRAVPAGDVPLKELYPKGMKTCIVYVCLGTPQQKPKRLRLLADVSGSMYRFNGLDSRLERSMEAVCMVMEALESYEHKFKYDIVGHSGDGFDIELVRCDKIPKNNKERLKVLKTMHAHSQFCMSGDYTLESTEHAVKEISREEADEYFVIVLSDANLERYGISPDRFAQALTCNPQVNAFAVLIGSLGDQAVRLQRTLPAGRSFVAMDTKQIPQILQQIFTSTMLSSA